MITIPFTAIVSGLIIAVVPPAKVTDLEANSSAEQGLKRPAVIHVRSFSISKSAANPQNADGGGRPHLLGRLRGGEETLSSVSIANSSKRTRSRSCPAFYNRR